MALLTCLRKHRTLRVYRHQRGYCRHQAYLHHQAKLQLQLASRPLLILPTAHVEMTSVSPPTSGSSSSNSMPGSNSIPAKVQPTSSHLAIPPIETRSSEPTQASTHVPLPGSGKASPWRALFMPFLALLPRNDTETEASSDVENDANLLDDDDFFASSVPPHLSAVWTPPEPEQKRKQDDEEKPVVESNQADADAAKSLFWRYDMESYAANRRNEDRSQYFMDVIQRPNQDAPSNVFFCGCYDGHGGEEAVEFVRQRLYAQIKHLLQNTPLPVRDAIIEGFQQTDAAFHRRSMHKFARGMWSSCSVGACAVIAMLVDGKLFVAGCGDCRAIMAFRQADGDMRVEQITWDHSANDAQEQQRLRQSYPNEYDIVRQVGIDSFYVKGRLQPTRSLGDTYMKVQEVNRAPMPRGLRIQGEFERPYITATPDVFEVDLTNRHPEFLVLGSDGLYGELSNDEIVELVVAYRAKGVANVSKMLLSSVLNRVAEDFGYSLEELETISPGERRNYHDDITIDILHFSPPGALTSSSSSSCSSATEPEAEEVMLASA